MKILIVEDEPSLQEVIQKTLEKERYVVELAGNLADAMEKTGVYDYDCILSLQGMFSFFPTALKCRLQGRHWS